MTIAIPDAMDQRESKLSPLELLKLARLGIDDLAVKYPMIGGVSDVTEIYAKLDGAIYKLENVKQKVEEGSAGAPSDTEESDEPMSASQVGKLIWGLLTKE